MKTLKGKDIKIKKFQKRESDSDFNTSCRSCRYRKGKKKNDRPTNFEIEPSLQLDSPESTFIV